MDASRGAWRYAIADCSVKHQLWTANLDSKLNRLSTMARGFKFFWLSQDELCTQRPTWLFNGMRFDCINLIHLNRWISLNAATVDAGNGALTWVALEYVAPGIVGNSLRQCGIVCCICLQKCFGIEFDGQERPSMKSDSFSTMFSLQNQKHSSPLNASRICSIPP
eukprot:Gb_23429 [translate_table: standard]